jgi:hypothetical protein
MHTRTAKIAERFGDRVEILAHGSSREDLTDARVGVALDGILHNVEAGKRQERGAADGHEHADPCGVVDAAVAVSDDSPDLFGRDAVSEM